MKTKLITRKDIESVVLAFGLDDILDSLIEKLGNEFRELAHRESILPARTGIQYSNPDLGLMEWMPASVNAESSSLKIVGYHPSNPHKRKLPTVISSICLFDTQSGHLKAALDGTFLTALRTGAMSAVATAKLAPTAARTLGLIGCGAQAVTQAHALSRITKIDRILAYDKDPKALQSLQSRVAFIGISVVPFQIQDLPNLLEQCDILCTSTSEAPGHGPVIPDFHNKPSLHINAIGSDFPNKHEIPLSLLERSYVCPDFMEQAVVEGECQQLKTNQIGLELTHLLNAPEVCENQRSKLTVFDSTGHAYSDYVTSLLFLDLANQLGLGNDVEIECTPPDPQNPYSFLPDRLKEETMPSATMLSGITKP